MNTPNDAVQSETGRTEELVAAALVAAMDVEHGGTVEDARDAKRDLLSYVGGLEAARNAAAIAANSARALAAALRARWAATTCSACVRSGGRSSPMQKAGRQRATRSSTRYAPLSTGTVQECRTTRGGSAHDA